MGCVGLSLSDFERLTPEEFRSVCKSYAEHEESETRDAWTRMRMLACITIQPHVRQGMTPERLLPLPWDKPKSPTQKVAMSKEEAMRRFAEVAHRSAH